ncbi:hypothetical protein AYL99_02723 [Fonsecaea erecta]|uniref:DUF3533 domain-containing protein n=1 Tax=Fonsecaea erecta TaxID=1367422 RepID=A0A178ZVP3_9EURO|nr:hypothetical protein AYL99_02723 [Fonsecaea erecta]OAP63496.1 hypothetical protein AYL99_02723 [Fonsecaea erecta]
MRCEMCRHHGWQGKQSPPLTRLKEEDVDCASEQSQARDEPPVAHNVPCPDATLLCTAIKRFPSLNRSIVESDQSSSTLAEKDEEDDESPKDLEDLDGVRSTSTAGFFDPSLSQMRSAVLQKYSWTLALLCAFILGVLSLHWGFLFRVHENLSSATIAVVDFDATSPPYENVEPIVGHFIKATISHERATQRYSLGYKFLDPGAFRHDPGAIHLAVHEEKYWGAIIVNSNASALLRRAVEQGNVSYDPFGAGAVVVNQARDIKFYSQYITPVLTRLASDISFAFGRNWTQSVLANDSLAQRRYSNAPQALSPGIGFSLFDVRPFDPPTAIPTVSMGFVYLMVVALFSFAFFVPTHMEFVLGEPSHRQPPLKFMHLVIWRYLSTIVTYFFLSLCYSLVGLAFHARYFGHATFVVYWMLNWLGMAAIGLACENVAMAASQPWPGLWLLFWIVSNTSTGFCALELAPGFFKWGHAWPLRQVVYGSRTLLFGTQGRLGLNFGILVAWAGIGTVLFPCCCWIMRRKEMKTHGESGLTELSE